ERAGLVLARPRGFESGLEVEAVDLERGRDLFRDELERDLLGGAGVVGRQDRDRPGLADPVKAAVRLAERRRGGLELVPNGGRKGDEVVEPGADGVRIDEED